MQDRLPLRKSERERERESAVFDADNSMRTAALTGAYFRDAADAWLESRRAYLAPRTYRDYQQYIGTLSLFFRELKLGEIYGDDIRNYQRVRSQTACPSRINQECSIIQQMLKRIGRWQEIDYQALPARRESRGRALSDQQYDRLFRIAKSRPQWEMAYLFAAISVNTTAGPKEIWTLRFQDIDLTESTIRVQPEGAKNQFRVRVIPLNEIARAAVERALELARKRGCAAPDHFLFPFRVQGNSISGVYDPSRHCTTCKSAWRQLTQKAGLDGLRPYDLRHTAITDILQDPDVSEETAKAIAGHISQQILKTYSHIRISAKRAALDSIFKRRGIA